MVNHQEPKQAEILASLLKRSAGFGYTSVTIQRSHRFPTHIFIQIENMARMADVSISVIINQLLECGLEAVHAQLNSDEIQEVHKATQEQVDRSSKTISVSIKPKLVKAVK